MLKYEANGTLDQWLGFVFDIEGESYRWSGGFDTIEDAIAEWNSTFEYIYNDASVRRNKTIEMENVGSHIFGTDMLIDGDMDNQMIEGYATNVPERFTSYAPMIYRCMTDDDKCTKEDPLGAITWLTSYNIYESLYILTNTVGVDKSGAYLGITNCSCYSCGIPQYEPATWGDQTGLGNLIRDTLIAKDFGIQEVTYFLQWSVGNPAKFGAFDSYGIDFLEVLNASVNENPPTSFEIYYRHADAQLTSKIYRDVLGDIARPIGMILAWMSLMGAVFVGMILQRKELKKYQLK
jgi:hypothetical protein